EPRVLEDEGDLLRVGARDGLGVDEDAAGVGTDEPADHAEDGGLATPARTQEGDELARAHRQAHAIDRGHGTAWSLVALAHAVDDDGCAGDHSCPWWLGMVGQSGLSGLSGLRLCRVPANVKSRGRPWSPGQPSVD